MKYLLIFLLPLSILANVSTTVYVCTHKQNKLVRKAELIHEPEDCQVVYSKPYEGVKPQVIFSAKNKPQYCIDKFFDFIERRMERELGWRCDRMKDDLIYGR